MQKLADETEALEKKVYIPGQWRCPKCNFRLTQSNLYIASGTVGPRDEAGDKCPNCNRPLWRVSAMQDRNEAYQCANDTFERVERLSKALKTACQHIDHMAAWITKQNAGYMFESLGEDMPDIRATLTSAGVTAQPDDHTQVSREPNPAPQAGCAKEGWKLVPIEPTREMLHAATVQVPTWDDEASLRKYRAMLSASPPPPVAESGWQEIETAPKGERVQLYNELWEDTYGAVQIGVRMDDAADIKWLFDSGMDISSDSNWTELELTPEDYEPVRWRPLPAPPHIAEEREKP